MTIEDKSIVFVGMREDFPVSGDFTISPIYSYVALPIGDPASEMFFVSPEGMADYLLREGVMPERVIYDPEKAVIGQKFTQYSSLEGAEQIRFSRAFGQPI